MGTPPPPPGASKTAMTSFSSVRRGSSGELTLKYPPHRGDEGISPTADHPPTLAHFQLFSDSSFPRLHFRPHWSRAKTTAGLQGRRLNSSCLDGRRWLFPQIRSVHVASRTERFVKVSQELGGAARVAQVKQQPSRLRPTRTQGRFFGFKAATCQEQTEQPG